MEEEWAKSKNVKIDVNVAQREFLQNYFAKRKLKFVRDVPIKKSQIHKFIMSGMPLISALFMDDKFLEILLARNEIRTEQVGTKKWREYLAKEERKTIKDVIKKFNKPLFLEAFVIGFNKDSDEYLIQFRSLEKRPCLWLSADEFAAINARKDLWVITPQ